MDRSTESISEWLGRLKTGEAEAAQKLWERYYVELQSLARQRLNKFPRGISDEEDVALSVLDSVFRGAAQGRFENVTKRDELWWLLLTVSKRKVVDHVRRATAKKRQPSSEGGTPTGVNGSSEPKPYSLDELVGASPTPDLVVALDEQYRRLLSVLPNDPLREIAVLRIEGYTVGEIAERLSIGERSVERKLQLIRASWKNELVKMDNS